MTTDQAPPQADPPEDFDDQQAVLMVKLIEDLDAVIQGLKRMVRPSQPWQRQLLALLADADRQMQILRMTEAMEKSDGEIAGAAEQLGATCRRITLAIRGSRADATVKRAASIVSSLGEALSKLMLAESLPDDEDAATAG